MLANLPYGAAEIVALRAMGKKPADLVLISFLGPLPGENNPLVIAKPERSYDWRFVVGLKVMAIACMNTPNLRPIIKTIEAAQPVSLSVWFADKQNGSNLLIDGYRPGCKQARQMGLQQRRNLVGLGESCPPAECLQQIEAEAKAAAIAHADRFDPVLLEMATAGLRRLFSKG